MGKKSRRRATGSGVSNLEQISESAATVGAHELDDLDGRYNEFVEGSVFEHTFRKPAEAAQTMKDENHLVDSLLERAQKCMDSLEMDLAAKFVEKAVEARPRDPAILALLGEIYMDIGDLARAKEVLEKCVSIDSEGDAGKWLYLAQLGEGFEAYKHYQKGVSLLLEQLDACAGQDPENEMTTTLKRQLCSAYCSMVELFMTDLCFEENAEEKCEEYTTLALRYDVGTPEPQQALANLRLTQGRMEEAAGYMAETYRRITESDENNRPPLEFRLTTGKLLIEGSMYEEAADILESVLQEDDEDVEIWYLLGLCYFHLDVVDDALEYFQKAQEMIAKQRKDQMNQGDDLEMYEDLESAIQEGILLAKQKTAEGSTAVE